MDTAPMGPALRHWPKPQRQDECLAVIVNHWRAYHEAPTRSEIGRAMGITRVSAHLLIAKLEAAGRVTTTPGYWRNVEPT